MTPQEVQFPKHAQFWQDAGLLTPAFFLEGRGHEIRIEATYMHINIPKPYKPQTPNPKPQTL